MGLAGPKELKNLDTEVSRVFVPKCPSIQGIYFQGTQAYLIDFCGVSQTKEIQNISKISQKFIQKHQDLAGILGWSWKPVDDPHTVRLYLHVRLAFERHS